MRVDERIGGLIDHLTRENLLHDRAWRTALREIPRHLFVPSRAWAASNAWHGASRAIDRRANPTDWWNACYEPASIITQRGDGAIDPADPAGTPTCSLSSPTISLPYLELLDVADHHRVLEVGTGTGWSAAMLAWRLSGEQVVTVEVDKSLVETAQENLERAGQSPTVVCGDGADGWADGALYDRVHVTCGIRDIPYSWVEQTRPGGTIVLPWMPHPEQYGQQLRLTVMDDGTAVGTLCGGGGYMMLRSQRADVPDTAGLDGKRSVTQIDPRNLNTDGVQLALASYAPGLAWVDTGHRADGAWVHSTTLWDITGDSLATVTQRPDGDYDVIQAGERVLWDEAQDALMQWATLGRPGRDAYRMFVSSVGQELILTRA